MSQKKSEVLEDTNSKFELKKSNSLIKSDTNIVIENIAKSESISTCVVDDYPVKNQIFKGNYGLIKSGEIVSLDKVWLSNKSIHQTLVFELYTDYHRIVTFHFDNQMVSQDFINRMELHIEGGELATITQKIKYFNGLIEQSIEVNENQFVSEKGVAIGMDKKKAIVLYGKPDKEKTSSEFEILEWYFIGDIFNESINSKKPIAKDSFGHSVTMFFKDNRLVGQILFNDIP